MRLAAAALAAAACLVVAAARAAPAAPPPAAATPAPRPATPERPPLAPTREASVLYRIGASNGPPSEVRVTIKARGEMLRMDMPDNTYILVNPAEQRLALVVPGDLMVLDLPWQPGLQDQFLLSPRMRFNKRGPDTVAGIRCTGWDMVLDNSRAILWITDDGVLLRSVSLDAQGRRNLIEAVSVSYTPAPASDFLPPPDFEHMAGPSPEAAGQ